MGCFLGCFGGEKGQSQSPKRRKHRVHRASPQRLQVTVPSYVDSVFTCVRASHLNFVELCWKIEELLVVF